MPYPRFSLQRSWLLTGILGLLHVLSLAIIALVTLPAWLKWMFASWICISAWRSISTQGLRTSTAAVCDCWCDQHAWYLKMRDDTLLPAQLLGCSFISPLVSVLNFKCAKRNVAVTIMPDAIEPEAYRRLRVYLTTTA